MESGRRWQVDRRSRISAALPSPHNGQVRTTAAAGPGLRGACSRRRTNQAMSSATCCGMRLVGSIAGKTSARNAAASSTAPSGLADPASVGVPS